MNRGEALAALTADLERARGGEPRFVLVEGGPGVGKTALVERVAEGRVLRCGGEPAEAGVPMALAGQLLAQAGAAEGEPLLDVLAQWPVVIVDDVQWADARSLEALAFALRRLRAARTLCVAIGRAAPEVLVRLAERAGGRRIVLAPLSEDELRALAAEEGVELSSAAARRLWAHTEGDLRLARALLAELAPDAWADFERRLPASRDLAAATARRLAACDAAELVAAAAVLGPVCSLADAAALAGAADPLAAADAAVEAGLLHAGSRDGLPSLEFRPPAAAAAVYERIGLARRASLHRSAAALVEDEAAALRHLAAAAVGPDDALAERLDAHAGRCHDRLQAASALVLASRLSAAREQREDRLVRAVDRMLLAGDAARAASHAAAVGACAPSARRDSVLGQLAMAGGHVREAGPWLASAWRRCDPREGELAATIAHRNAFHALIHLRDEEVIGWARRALELAPDDPLAVEWQATLALSHWRLGQRSDAHRLLDAALTGDAVHDAQLRGMAAWLRIAGDDVEEGRAPLAEAAVRELRMGAREIGVVHLNVLARAHFEVGAWDQADAVAREAVGFATRLEDVSARVFAWWAAVLVPAARGDWERADALARRAADEPTDAPDRVLAVAMAHALVAAARGQAEAVLEALAPVTAIEPAAAVEAPGFWPWQHIYGEALLGGGRLEDAERFVARHEPLARERGHATAAARLTSLRARLLSARGDREAADAAFADALALLGPLERPFDRALIQLAAGQVLRRDGRRRSASAHLTAAAEGFAALGAAPALERAERELLATGLRPARRESGTTELTPQEVVVAQLVGGGASNREVAAELQLSVKTVEVHLTRIYAKLGIASRTQLAHRMASS